MNKHYLELVIFFDEALENVNAFMKGSVLPFGDETVITRDEILNSLLADWDHDDQVVVCLNILLPALCKLCKGIFADHLPGGCWENVTEEMRVRTSGAMKHNKFAESVFGYLDILLRMKPNISTLATEAYVMFSANKTKEWLDSKSGVEKGKLVEEAMKSVPKIRESFKNRTKEIERGQRRRLEEQLQQAEQAERRRLERLEKYSRQIIFFGLWQSDKDVDSALKEINKNKEKIEALKAQLNFRKHVLKQDPKVRDIYRFSANQKYLSIEELTANVKRLVQHAFTIDTGNDDKQPILTGKMVEHRFKQDDGDGEDQWWKGTVISQVPGYPRYFNLVYTDDPAVYVYPLVDDYRNGDLKLVHQQ